MCVWGAGEAGKRGEAGRRGDKGERGGMLNAEAEGERGACACAWDRGWECVVVVLEGATRSRRGCCTGAFAPGASKTNAIRDPCGCRTTSSSSSAAAALLAARTRGLSSGRQRGLVRR